MKYNKTLNQLVLEQATGFRCGVTLPFQEVENTFADISGIFNVSLPEDTAASWQSASGSISRDNNQAIMGAIAEAMERYSSAVYNFPIKSFAQLQAQNLSYVSHKEFALFSEEQTSDKKFLWPDFEEQDVFFGEVYSIYDNKK